MDVRMLGPVQVRVRDQLVDLGPAKQRCVLAALAVQAGRPVPTGLLVERVWGDDPPGDARNALYSYVTRLRRVTGARIPRTDQGYLLDTSPEAVDLHRFTATRRLDRALDEWRGEPLDGLSGEWVDQMRAGLHRKRVGMLAAWADGALAEGRAAEVVERIGAALDEYPHTERLIMALLHGLHAAGRTAEALEQFETCRVRLSAELGAAPGAELRELHVRLLHGESAPIARPAQLPAAPRGFVGRTEQLRDLDATRADVVVISGVPGVGKTALALHWAHRVVDRFPDGQLHADLGRGGDPVPGFLRALGVDVPTDRKAAAARLRALLAGRRMLMLLDDVADPSQVRPLLPDHGGCLVVVTSPSQLDDLDGTRVISLRPLCPVKSVEVLTERLGHQRIAGDQAGAQELAEACGGLPLALRIAAATLLDRPGSDLAAHAREMRAGIWEQLRQYAVDRAG